MATLSFFIGVIGNVISVLMFLAPVETFKRVIEHKSTEEFESLPYVCTLLNAALWTYYGIIKPGAYLVSTVNGFGVLVEIIYVALFLVYAPPKMKVKTGIMIGILDVGFLGAAILVTRLALDGVDVRISATGFVCAGLNIIMYASPLAAMKTVVTTKSVEFMPFLLSFFFFLNGAIWTFYAFLTSDIFLGVPNGMGFLLGSVQIILYLIYRKGKANIKSDDKFCDVLEQGWQYEALIPSSSSAQPQPSNEN